MVENVKLPASILQKVEDLWKSRTFESSKTELAKSLGSEEFAALQRFIEGRGFDMSAKFDATVAGRLLHLLMLSIYHSDGLAFVTPEERQKTTARWANDTAMEVALVRSLISAPPSRDI